MRLRRRIFVLVCAGAPAGLLSLGVWAALRIAAPGDDASLFGQPRSERAAQARLPRSTDPVWTTLRRTAISEDDAAGAYRARFPPEVAALAGRTVTVSGYLTPLDARGGSDHFMLSKYTPVCPFCPPGQPNEVIEVHSAGPVFPDERMLTVTGRFGIHQDGGTGLFFHLDQARVDE